MIKVKVLQAWKENIIIFKLKLPLQRHFIERFLTSYGKCVPLSEFGTDPWNYDNAFLN